MPFIQKHHGLIYLSPTHWNSLFDSIAQLIKIKEKLNHLLNVINNLGKSFKDTVIKYMKEFCNVIKSIAVALDCFQAENNHFHGIFLPIEYIENTIKQII